jgi:hypothetical protein
MNSIYCPNCGYKNNYEGARVKFCSSCGQPFDKSAATLVRPAAKITTTTIIAEEPLETESEGLGIGFDKESFKNLDESKMMTIGSVRQEGGGSFERDDNPDSSELRQKAQATLLQEVAQARPAPITHSKRGRPRKK